MKKRIKVQIALVLATLALGAGISAAAWGLLIDNSQTFAPRYLTYRGVESRIYAVSETTSYHQETSYYPSEGTPENIYTKVFSINLTLRNDYSTENPPPNKGTPVSPIDGTAYLQLNAKIFNGDSEVEAANIGPSEFTVPEGQTGVVLASGQTANVTLIYATNQTQVTGYSVTLETVSDSIQK